MDVLTQKFNFFLHVIANKIMKSNQGDILIDHQRMLETLKTNGEIELYIDTMHFDTENRFQYDDTMSIADARKEARDKHWGAYNILLKIDGENIKAWVEKREGTDVRFPIEDMENYVDFVKYDIIDQYGKEKVK